MTDGSPLPNRRRTPDQRWYRRWGRLRTSSTQASTGDQDLEAPAHPPNVFDVMTDLIVAMDPHVKVVKVGTVHEEHDGWGSRGDEVGVYRCSCGDDITDLIKGQP